MKKLSLSIDVCCLPLFLVALPFCATRAQSVQPIKSKLANLPLRATWAPPIIFVQDESEFMFSGSNKSQSFAYYELRHWDGKHSKDYRVFAAVGELYQSVVTSRDSGDTDLCYSQRKMGPGLQSRRGRVDGRPAWGVWVVSEKLPDFCIHSKFPRCIPAHGQREGRY